MEILGTVSMLFEISFLLGSAGKINTPDSNVDALVMRAARTAKMGARAGRLAKLFQCIAFIYGNQDMKHRTTDAPVGDTKMLGTRLSHYLSSKAAMLTIFFV